MKVYNSNLIINSLWIGNSLSIMELLTIKSFMDHGHEFHLWLYSEMETSLPEGVVLEDANQIIPEDKIFSYKNANQYGHGKGSFAGFSDIFRYKLLYEKGGWWVDMDVTCLKPFNFKSDFVFREHSELLIVGNVMKCPPKTDFMKCCYEEAIESVDEKNSNWLKPIEILNTNLLKHDLEQYIMKDISIPDHYGLIRLLCNFRIQESNQMYFIHWCNEEWRHRFKNKNKFKLQSFYGQTLIKHGVLQDNFTKLDRILNYISSFQIKIYLYRFFLNNPNLYQLLRIVKHSVRKTTIDSKGQLTLEYLKKISLNLK
jgi:mannosyltransferase OCH1-like enzyme